MRELDIMEIESVSGGSFFTRVAAAFLGAIAGADSGMMKGGVAAGSTGGILGAGVFSALVGIGLGAIFGSLTGAIYGFVNDWDRTLDVFNDTCDKWVDPVVPPAKV